MDTNIKAALVGFIMVMVGALIAKIKKKLQDLTSVQKYAIIRGIKDTNMAKTTKQQVEECVEIFETEVKAGKEPVAVLREIRQSTLRMVFIKFLEAINKEVELDQVGLDKLNQDN